MQKTFQLVNLSRTIATVHATLVIRIPPLYAESSTMAEDLSQITNRRSHPFEGGQYDAITLAHSCHQGNPCREKWLCSSGRIQNPQRRI